MMTDRELFTALLALSGLGQGRSADLSGLVRQNVSSWHTGRDNALSEDKKLKLLSVLGIEYGSLKPVAHRWSVSDLSALKCVLNYCSADACLEVRTWHPTGKGMKSLFPYSALMGVYSNGEPPTWILATRPLMSRRPDEICSETLRHDCPNILFYDAGEIEISAEQWGAWLLAGQADPDEFSAMMSEPGGGLIPGN